MERKLKAVLTALLLAVALLPARARGQTAPADATTEPGALAARVQQHIAALASYVDRAPGTAGAAATADYFAQQLQAKTGQPVYRQRFSMAVPQLNQASIEANGKSYAVWPLLPMGGQLPAIRASQGRAPLVYVGDGSLGQLQGKTIAGAWVALELHSYQAWQQLGALGARGVLFLAPERGLAPAQDFMDKDTNVPLGLPRLYVTDQELAGQVRRGVVSSIAVTLDVKWVNRAVDNLFCVIPGVQGTPGSAKEPAKWWDESIILQARYDASSQVIGRSPGAQQAANAAAVVEIAGAVAHEPRHSTVVVVLTGADEWLFEGTREMLELVRPEDKDQATALVDLQTAVTDAAAKAKTAQQVLAGIKRAAQGDFSSLQQAEIRDALQDQLDRQTSQIEEILQRLRLQADQTTAKQQVARYNEIKTALMNASTTVKRQYEFTAATRADATEAAKELVGPWSTEVARRDAELAARTQWVEIRKLFGATPLLHVNVDLSAGAPRFGLFARSNYGDQAMGGRMATVFQNFRHYIGKMQGGEVARPGEFRFEFDTTQSNYTLESFFPIPRGFGTDLSLQRQLPAASFATINDIDTIVDTPEDTAANINWVNLGGQLNDLEWLLLGAPRRGLDAGLLDDPFYVLQSRAELSNNADRQQLNVYERTLGDTIPRLGAVEHLVGIEQERAGAAVANMLGTRRMVFRLTHIDGGVTFCSLQKDDYVIQAFRFAADGTVNRAITQVQANISGLASKFKPDSAHPQRSMVIDAERLNVFGLFDPRYVDTLDKLQALDARRTDTLQFSSNFVRDGLGAVFMPPESRWMLLVSKGDISNRMVLVNSTPEVPLGIGFDTTNLAVIGPLWWQNALDLHGIDAKRKKDLESFGITTELIKQLQKDSETYIASGTAARAKLDYAGWLGSAAAAWSYQSLVYKNLIATSDGIIHGVIFLLLGIIPFSYFLERLVIGSTNVYKQIVGFAGIFALMTAMLWFHPAFRISSAPVMILLAFLILILSVIVIYILFGKFEEEIARMKGASATSHSANLKRGAVLGAAVRLGLSNMRRRGTRTTLTLTTLVLLTFTLLCFTSVREALFLTPRLVSEAPKNVPKGIMFRLRGWRGMPAGQIEVLVRSLAGAGGQTAERWWYASQDGNMPWQLPVVPVGPDGLPNGQLVTVQGLVGLQPSEQLFQGVDMRVVLPGWDKLATDKDVCWLPVEVGRERHLVAGDTVNILGRTLTIAGLFESDQVAQLRALNGDQIMPVDPKTSGASPQTTAATSPEDIAAMAEQSYQFLPPRSVAIVPASLVRRLNGRLSSVMILPGDPAMIIPRAEDLAKRSAFAVFASAPPRDRPDAAPQVRMYNAAASLRPENLDRVLVPMVIAGIIVLNTMLGAVAERTREIHVYTSIGLAPAHVGTLFLAEAAALGTLGVVFGYIFGQGMATILTAITINGSPLLGGVDLNYSSMSAIITMGLVLALVMLSSLWPARTATRVAAPSLERSWHLPKPHGDVLKVDLPFTVNAVAARGVCAFIDEYFASMTQSGSGRFTADQVKAFAQDGIRGITCRVWLAPYDLGVIQSFWLAVHPTKEQNVFEVKLTLRREAGNPATWFRLNRPFLVEVRKQFLLWRAVKPELVAAYVTRSEAMFAAPAAPPPPENEDVSEEQQSVTAGT